MPGFLTRCCPRCPGTQPTIYGGQVVTLEAGHAADQDRHVNTQRISAAICDAVRSGDDAPPDAPPARVCPGLYMSPCITDGDTGGAAGEAGCLSTGLCFDWAQVDSWPASWYTPRANMPEAEPEQAGAAADAIGSGH